jgi:hypothetical protein
LSAAFDDDGIKWVSENWTPRVLAAGIKYIGFVLPESEWAKMAVEEYTETVEKKGMTITYFKDVESAKNWFRNMSINQ